MNNLTLIKVYNPFNRRDQDICPVPYLHGQTLLDLRNTHYPKDIDVVVSINGNIIPTDQLAVSFPMSGDQMLFVPQVHGGGDNEKSVYRMVLMIAVAVASIYTMNLGGWYLVAGIGLSVVGGMAVNALLPPPRPELPTLGSGLMDGSQLYSWNPQTIQRQGVPIPGFYGVNKLYGNILGAFTDSDDNVTSKLSVLLSMGIGPQKSLNTFKINDQDSGLYKVVPEVRLGYLNQDVIHSFNNTKTEYTLNIHVESTSPYTYVTPGSNFDALEVEVLFPNGLWYMNNSGGLDSSFVQVKISIRKQGTTPWTYITNATDGPANSNIPAGFWSLGKWAINTQTGASYWFEKTRGTSGRNDHIEGAIEYVDMDGDYVNETPMRWRWVNDSEAAVNTLSTFYPFIAAALKPIRKKFTLPSIQTKGIYEIKIENLTVTKNDPRYGEAMYVTAIREIVYDGFIYPRQALVGLTAIATDKLSASFRFSCLTDGKYCRIWNGSTWSVDVTSNPAWVTFDILTQPVFDNNLAVVRYDGMDPSRIDLAKFLEWAAWCDDLVPDGYGGTEKRITFNGGFDSAGNMWEAAHRVCEIGRAVLIWRGINLTIAIDKPSDPVQLFTVGNINKNQFKESFMPLADRASEMTIEYINSAKGYDRDEFSIVNPDVDPGGASPARLQLFGVTKPSEAWRHARYRLACNQYLLSSAEWGADIDAIVCEPGDVVSVQHDIPTAGSVGGRIISATTTEVTIDREVTLSVGNAYSLWVRMSDDSIVIRSVTNAPGTYTVLSVSTPFGTAPAQYDPYAFGETATVTKPYRVLGIRKTRDLQCTITGVEYNASIYNTDNLQPALPTPNYDSLDPLPAVDDFLLDELVIARVDGTLEDVIDVYFTDPGSALFSYAEIWWNNGGGWIFSGKSYGHYRIANVETGKTYIVAAVTVNTAGLKQKIQNAPQLSILTLGKLDPPSIVQNFTAQQSDMLIHLGWTNIPDGDRQGYQVRFGASWDAGTLIVNNLAQNSWDWKPTQSGTIHFWIKAFDTSGLESATASEAVLVINGAPPVTGLTQQIIDNFVLLQWTGVPGTFPIKEYEVRKGDVYATSELLGTLTGTFFTWFEMTSGTYKYWITAIDTNDLLGTPNSVTATVSEPPDFELTSQWMDAFESPISSGLYYDSSDKTTYACVQTEDRVSDDFNRADENPLAGNWTTAPGAHALKIVSNQCVTTIGVNDGAYWSGGSFFNDQFAEFTSAVTDYGSLMLRCITSGSVLNLYGLTVSLNGVQLFKYVAGARSTIGSSISLSPPLQASDVIRFEAEGTVLRVKRNNIILREEIDTSLSSGSPGVFVYIGNPAIDNWRGGNLSSAPSWDRFCTAYSITTMQDFINMGGYVIEPMHTSAFYEQTYDAGVTVPGTMISVDVDKVDFKGSVAITPIVSVSVNNVDWITYTGAWKLFVNNFRYTKIHLAFAGTAADIVALNSLNVTLSVKLQNDSGSGIITNASLGSVFKFNKMFSDIKSATPAVKGAPPRLPIYVYVDAVSTCDAACTTTHVKLTAGQGARFLVDDWIKVDLITGPEVVQITNISTDDLTVSPALSGAPPINTTVYIASVRIYFYDLTGALTTGEWSCPITGY
ncbi:MAG: host specificity factor TipJ family phage tail protein [Nitrospirae bacterium]|nr:host specificity factor TipJ family phage tail protein [Nitrospirota bacterium]